MMTTLLIALILTVLLETLAARTLYRSVDTRRKLMVVIGVNLITNPLGNVAAIVCIVNGLPFMVAYAIVEAVVFAVEAAVYFRVLGMPPRDSIRMSFFLNALSLVFGTVGAMFLSLVLTAIISFSARSSGIPTAHPPVLP